VAALVIEDGGSEDEAIAALLHDSLEDQASN
jgi:(p)ppGpp synthase/HD superfamily hydrolase